MDPWLVFGLVIAGGYLFWLNRSNQKKEEIAIVAKEALRRENKLYDNIKKGVREHDWRMNEKEYFRKFLDAKHGDVLFENAEFKAIKLDHISDLRIGFFIKETNEYGIYSHFSGNDDYTHEGYYRTDSSFQKEELLAHDDD